MSRRPRRQHTAEHNACVLSDPWITDEERRAIIKFQQDYPLEGYRRLTITMLDGDVVAVSPTTSCRGRDPYRSPKSQAFNQRRPVGTKPSARRRWSKSTMWPAP